MDRKRVVGNETTNPSGMTLGMKKTFEQQRLYKALDSSRHLWKTDDEGKSIQQLSFERVEELDRQAGLLRHRAAVAERLTSLAARVLVGEYDKINIELRIGSDEDAEPETLGT